MKGKNRNTTTRAKASAKNQTETLNVEGLVDELLKSKKAVLKELSDK